MFTSKKSSSTVLWMLKPVQSKGSVEARVAVATLSLGSRMSDVVVPLPVQGFGGALPLLLPVPPPPPVLPVVNFQMVKFHAPEVPAKE